MSEIFDILPSRESHMRELLSLPSSTLPSRAAGRVLCEHATRTSSQTYQTNVCREGSWAGRLPGYTRATTH